MKKRGFFVVLLTLCLLSLPVMSANQAHADEVLLPNQEVTISLGEWSRNQENVLRLSFAGIVSMPAKENPGILSFAIVYDREAYNIYVPFQENQAVFCIYRNHFKKFNFRLTKISPTSVNIAYLRD